MGLSRTRLWWILVGAHQGVSPGPTFGKTYPRQDAILARDHPGQRPPRPETTLAPVPSSAAMGVVTAALSGDASALLGPRITRVL